MSHISSWSNGSARWECSLLQAKLESMTKHGHHTCRWVVTYRLGFTLALRFCWGHILRRLQKSFRWDSLCRTVCKAHSSLCYPLCRAHASVCCAVCKAHNLVCHAVCMAHNLVCHAVYKAHNSVCHAVCTAHNLVCHAVCKVHNSMCHAMCKTHNSVCHAMCMAHNSVCHAMCKAHNSVCRAVCKCMTRHTTKWATQCPCTAGHLTPNVILSCMWILPDIWILRPECMCFARRHTTHRALRPFLVQLNWLVEGQLSKDVLRHFSSWY